MDGEKIDTIRLLLKIYSLHATRISARGTPPEEQIRVAVARLTVDLSKGFCFSRGRFELDPRGGG